MKKLLITLIIISCSCILYAQHATVKSFTKISQTQGNLPITLQDGDHFGSSITYIGDLNSDGTSDIASGTFDGTNNGRLHIIFLNNNGTVKSISEIKEGQSGLPVNQPGDMHFFGYSVDTIGDLDQDGVIDIVVGVPYIVGGNSKGFVYLLFMNSDGTIKSHKVIGENLNGFSDNLTDTHFGLSVAGIGDLNNDGIFDIAVGGTKKDNYKGAIWLLFLNSDGTVKSQKRIDNSNPTLANYFNQSQSSLIKFGTSVAFLGDIDNDGASDIAVGSVEYQTNTGMGSTAILFLNSNGTIKTLKAIDQGTTNFSDTLLNYYDTLNPFVNTLFGFSITNLGDINGDFNTDIAISAPYFGESQCNKCGAVGIFMLDSLGNIKDYQRISDSLGNFSGHLNPTDGFGSALSGIGDFNGDNIVDLVASAIRDDDGGSNRGAVYILHLNGVPDTSPVNAIEKESTVNVFPNPAIEQITLEMDVINNEDTQWQLQDINGKLLLSGIIASKNKTKTINTKNLANGIYLVKLRNQTQVYTQKVVIAK